MDELQWRIDAALAPLYQLLVDQQEAMTAAFYPLLKRFP
jgi:hypothetical protein